MNCSHRNAEFSPRFEAPNLAMTIGSSTRRTGLVDNRDRINLDQIAGLGQRLHSYQRVGRLVVTEYRSPCLRDIGQVLRTMVNDVRS